jgi:D-proline reductase (dithiol) PrdB
MHKPDSSAVAALHDAYLAWREAARPELVARDWNTAFRNATHPYPYYTLRLDDLPLQRLFLALGMTRVIVLSSAGVYRDDQPRFDDADVYGGDLSYRIIPLNTDKSRLRLAHAHYDHGPAEQDINCVLPVDRLRGLEARGVIGAAVPYALSFSGYITDAQRLIDELAPDIVRQVKASGADGAVLVPV